MTIIACSLYISETVPTEKQPILGTTINLGIVLGFFIVYSFGLLLPSEKDTQEALENDQLWRVSYSLQLVNVFITSVMWLTLYRTEPVEFLMRKAEEKGRDSDAFKEALSVIGRNYGVID